MLSILIPVYNFDVREMVESLSRQCISLKIPFEIIVIDDASQIDFKIINRECKLINGVQYTEEIQNIGRSKIRNKLADCAVFENLLYLDCDSKIVTEDFIEKYIKSLNMSDVVYGGRSYFPNEPQNSNFALHWNYGINREQICAQDRSQAPNKSFMSNNFIITREAINRVRFNEVIRGYGHEDTLFGYDLHKNNINIHHIDNPVIHLGLEPNDVFLKKTREGIQNLKKIMLINGNEQKLTKDITLLAYYKKINFLKLTGLFRFLYSKTEGLLRKNLVSSKPSLILFDIYKLGYLCSIGREKVS